MAVFIKTLGLTYGKHSFLKSMGFAQSVKLRKPVFRDGSPMLWMNYAMINFLDSRLGPDQIFFEYGSGNSTAYFAERVKSITSLEQDKDWYEYVKGTIPPNAQLLYFDPDGGQEYADVAGTQADKYDVVVIDADMRSDRIFAWKGFPPNWFCGPESQ